MPDTLTTITKLINSPPGQLAAGGVLAGIVWKFFERVESVLNEDTKLEIAVWLLGVRVTPKLSRAATNIGTSFNEDLAAQAGCGTMLLIMALLLVAILATGVIGEPILLLTPRVPQWVTTIVMVLWMPLAGYCTISTVLPRKLRFRFRLLMLAYLAIPVCSLGLPFVLTGGKPSSFIPLIVRYPCLHFVAQASIWLVWSSVLVAFLPAISALIIRTASRLDRLFDLMNRRFDIEKKPLQSIGLVAGALVAVVYWAAVIVSRVVG